MQYVSRHVQHGDLMHAFYEYALKQPSWEYCICEGGGGYAGGNAGNTGSGSRSGSGGTSNIGGTAIFIDISTAPFGDGSVTIAQVS